MQSLGLDHILSERALHFGPLKTEYAVLRLPLPSLQPGGFP